MAKDQILPWNAGRPLVWDTSCPDTFADSYESHAAREAGRVADFAEKNKSGKYSHLAPSYVLQPVAIESSGAVGPSTLIFLKTLGRQISLATGEPQAAHFLFQRLSVAAPQRGNVAGVLGSALPPWKISRTSHFVQLYFLPFIYVYLVLTNYIHLTLEHLCLYNLKALLMYARIVLRILGLYNCIHGTIFSDYMC